MPGISYNENALYSHYALEKQGGALCSPREILQLIGQSVPKRQPPEVLMTLDREFEFVNGAMRQERAWQDLCPVLHDVFLGG